MAVPYTVNLPGGGQVVVNANSPEAALENAGNPVGATVSGGSYTGGGGGGGGGGGSTGGGGAGGQQLASGINSLLGAIASGNKQAFDEAVRQFNATFGLDERKFTEAVRQFNEGLGITQAGLTGYYQGSPTQQAQLQAANIAAQQAGLTGYYTNPFAGGGVTGALTGAGAPGVPGIAAGPTVAGGLTQDQINAIQQGMEQQIGQGAWRQGQFLADLQRGVSVQEAAARAADTRAPWTLPALPKPGGAYPGQVAGAGAAGGNNMLTQVPLMPGGGGAGASGMPGGVPTMAREQQTYAQQMGMINAAAALQANPFRQQQAMGQMGRLLGGQGVAGFQAPNTVAGVGVAGGNTQGGLGYLQQMVDDIRDPSANTASMNQILQGIPTPNKVNSVEFLRAAPSTQNMVLQGMQEKYGLDPNDALTQIKNTLPGFSAPSTFGGIRR